MNLFASPTLRCSVSPDVWIICIAKSSLEKRDPLKLAVLIARISLTPFSAPVSMTTSTFVLPFSLSLIEFTEGIPRSCGGSSKMTEVSSPKRHHPIALNIVVLPDRSSPSTTLNMPSDLCGKNSISCFL